MAALRSGKGVYRLGELGRLTGHSESAVRQAARRLVERGWLAHLGRALYANLLRAEGPPTVEEAAAVLYPPSYISLDSALFDHGIAEQAPHLLTCVTTNKTRRFRTGLGEIHYHQIQPALFFGYDLTRGVARAYAEKAVLDSLYLELRTGRSPAVDEWNWEELDLDLVRSWARHYPSTVVDRVPAESRPARRSGPGPRSLPTRPSVEP